MEEAHHLYRWSLVHQIVILVNALVTLYVLKEKTVHPGLLVLLCQVALGVIGTFVNIHHRLKQNGTNVQVVNISKGGQAIIIPNMVSLA